MNRREALKSVAFLLGGAVSMPAMNAVLRSIPLPTATVFSPISTNYFSSASANILGTAMLKSKQSCWPNLRNRR